MEIRRIREDEGEAVAALWQELAGGVVTPERQARIARMLATTAFHRDACTLVAVEDGRVTGFVLARVDTGDGLLKGGLGLVEERWPLDEPRLVDAAIAHLREAGVKVIRADAELDDPAEQARWRDRGWEAETVRFAIYP
jgi:predicted phage gp36 major capsid-like protein